MLLLDLKRSRENFNPHAVGRLVNPNAQKFILSETKFLDQLHIFLLYPEFHFTSIFEIRIPEKYPKVPKASK